MLVLKSPKPLNELFENNRHQSNLVQYQQKTKDFRAIKSLLFEHLDDNIAENIIVSNFKNSILYLETTSAAIATAFKMYQSRILSQVRQQINPATVTIEMKVSPKSTLVNHSNHKRPNSSTSNSNLGQNEVKHNARVLPSDVALSIEALANTLDKESDSKLKQSLLKLARHKTET